MLSLITFLIHPVQTGVKIGKRRFYTPIQNLACLHNHQPTGTKHALAISTSLYFPIFTYGNFRSPAHVAGGYFI